jgi:hypothetical protein
MTGALKTVTWLYRFAVPAFFLAYGDFSAAADGAMAIAARPISVRQQGKNSLEAKEKAVARAVRAAFYQMLRENYHLSQNDVGKLSLEQINRCISDYSVEQEKQSESYYMARLAYKFDRIAVKNLLLAKNLWQDLDESGSAEVSATGLRSCHYLSLPTSTFLARHSFFEKIEYNVLEFSGKTVVLKVQSPEALKNLHL